MNIIEALNSGQPFKRPHMKDYHCDVDGDYIMRIYNGHCESHDIIAEDIRANDWQIEEKKIELTRSQFERVWFNVFLTSTIGGLAFEQHFKEICKELGL